MRLYALIAPLALTGTLALPACKSAAQAEAGIFTTEQVICMVAAVTQASTTGTAEQVAADVVATCGFLPAINQDVINFVNAWNNLSPAAKARAAKYAQEHKR